MKQKVDQKNYDEKNVCFICGKTRNDCINDPKNSDFDKHLRKHDKWKYIIYMMNIILKNKEEYNNEEYYIWRQIKNKKLNWFPKYDKEGDNQEIKNKESKENEEGEKIVRKSHIDERKLKYEEDSMTDTEINIFNENY